MALDLEPEILRRHAPLILVVAALAATAIPAIRHIREAPPPVPPAIRLAFPVPAGVELGLGDDSLDAAISPDETEIVFVATTDGVPRLWRRALDADTAAPLAGTEGARLPAWKRGGAVVAFFANGKLKQISLADGATRELTDAAVPGGAAWLADGSLLFAPGSDGPLRRLRDGVLSDATMLQAGDRAHVFPNSATGSEFVYVAVRTDGRRVIRLVRNGDHGDLAATSGHAQLIGEHLLHVRDGVLLAERIDPEKMTRAGRAIALAASAGVSPSGHAAFAASSRLLLVAQAVAPVREMAWFDEMGRRTGTVGEPGDYRQIRLSPDDRDVAVTMVDPLLKTLDVVIMPTDRAADRERLTLALAADSDPVWSPDASRVIFRSLEDGRPKLFTRRAHDPAAPIESGPVSDTNDTATDWRGPRVLVTVEGASGRSDILAVDAADGSSRAAVADTGFNEADGRWSPDGAWVAYVSDESGRPDVYAITWPGKERRRVSFAGGAKPRWSGDGRSLFFLRGAQVMRSDLQSGRFGTPQPILSTAGIRDIDVARRSRRLLVLLSMQGDPVTPTTIVNWAGRLAE